MIPTIDKNRVTQKPVLLLWLHGLYFAIPSIWPLVHMPSFLAVTRPKTDLWLVQTVALLLLVMSAVFITAALTGEYQTYLGVLAIGSTVAMAWVDIYFATNNVIWNTYLLDAVGELLLLIAWIYYLFKKKRAKI